MNRSYLLCISGAHFVAQILLAQFVNNTFIFHEKLISRKKHPV